MDAAWSCGAYHKMTVWYNYFKNTMKQIPIGFQLFPLSKIEFEKFIHTLDIIIPKKQSTKNYNSTHMALEPNKKTIVKKAYEIMMSHFCFQSLQEAKIKCDYLWCCLAQ